MYIARSVSLGKLLTEMKSHTDYQPMPELHDKARELYIQAWGDEIYQRYCDPADIIHGCPAVDPAVVMDLLSGQYKSPPSVHRPEHDVESTAFWSFFVTSLQIVPAGSEDDDERSPRYHRDCYNMSV